MLILKFSGVMCYEALIGLGIGWIVCGALQAAKGMRYVKDGDYRKKYDTEAKDERNRYISLKAWAWAGYIFVIISALAAVIGIFAGDNGVAASSSSAIGVMVLLYLISYLVLRKKY